MSSSKATGVAGIQHDARARAVALDEVKSAVEMGGGFIMHRNLIGAGFNEDGRVGVGVVDHQVDVEREFGDLADRFNHRRTESQIGDEMAVHYVDVEHGGAAAFHFGDIVA